MTENSFLRQTAHILWISDLVKGEYIKSTGEFQPNYVIVRDMKIARVNLIGAVISKNVSDNFSSIMIDDSSGALAVRVWKDNIFMLQNIAVGDLVLIVGKIKSFNNRIYVIPDFVRKLENKDWAKVRKLGLIKKYGAVDRIENPAEIISDMNFDVPDFEHEDIGFISVQEEAVKEEKVSDAKVENINEISVEAVNGNGFGNARGNILKLAQEMDLGDGADIEQIILKSGLKENEAQSIIDDLIREGEVFEIKPGRLRSLL
jgi:RPA family protein